MPTSLWITADFNPKKMSPRVWQLQSGSMAVFAVTANADPFNGKRRYLFNVTANEAVFEIHTAKSCPYRLLAIALEKPVLLELDPHPLRPETLVILATCWLQRLESVFVPEISVPEISAPEVIPVTSLSATVASNWDMLQTELTPHYRSFFQRLTQLEAYKQAQALDQLQQRTVLNHQAAELALEGLANVIDPRPTDSPILPGESALLVAAGAVGKQLGISIQAPVASENWQSQTEPIEAIARASHIRVRRISLGTDWWTHDQGPLLGYLQLGDRPVALLPLKSGHYRLFDPEAQTSSPMSDRLATQLSPIAYTFYRSFPHHILSIWEIVRLTSQGLENALFKLLWVGVIATLVGMFTPVATGFLIDQTIPNANQRVLLQVGFGLFSASLGVAIFQLAQRQILLNLQTTTDLAIQSAVWDRLLKLKLSFFRQYSIGDLKNRVAAIGHIRALLSGATLPTLFTSLFSLLNVLLLFFYSANLAWIAIIIAGVALLVNNTIRLMARQQLRALQALEGDLFGTVVQIIGGIAKLRVAGAEHRAFAYWAQHYRQQLALVVSTQFLEDCLTVFNTVLPTLSSILFFWFTIDLITSSSIQSTGLSTGAFLGFNAAFGTFIAGVTSLSDRLFNMVQASILWERTRPILVAQLEVDESNADPGQLSGHLQLDRVTFRYRPNGPLILDRITLRAAPGEFIALVGPSGSGKSTIIRLVLGFETPQHGTIYYDGQDLSKLDLRAVRRQLGVVLQNGRINSASLLENIAAGALITLDEAWDAAKRAGFAEDIQAMPMGMHTIISEGGSNLSGGQRQRLLIARALVLNPKILILDEATSALDNLTQAVISHHLEQLQMTRIAIAHRLSTIRNADRIYVLDHGSIVQQGTFEQLVDQPGIFQKMMMRQIA